jgi:hypothetical protein
MWRLRERSCVRIGSEELHSGAQFYRRCRTIRVRPLGNVVGKPFLVGRVGGDSCPPVVPLSGMRVPVVPAWFDGSWWRKPVVLCVIRCWVWFQWAPVVLA